MPPSAKRGGCNVTELFTNSAKQFDTADYIQRGQELMQALVHASYRLTVAMENFDREPTAANEVEMTRATAFSVETRNRVTDWRNEQ